MAPPTLLRIPFSHFCRKAEWGLTQAGLPYDALDVRIWDMAHTHRVNPHGTVPVLRVGDHLLQDSHDILVWADEHRDPSHPALYPQGQRLAVADWETRMGQSAGAATRLEAYRALQAEPGRGKRYDLPLSLRVPPVARRVFLGVLKHYKARRSEATDPGVVRSAIEETAARLEATGTGYLFGAQPTAADVTTAALLEPCRLFIDSPAYQGVGGWDIVDDFVTRVKPQTTTLRRSRRVKEADWRAWEALNLTQGVLDHGPMAA